MAKKDLRIDAYIERSAPFAKTILNHIRKLVHKTCPEVEETMKWSFPHFDYKGEMMCSMAAFKEHCAFGFWKAALMKDPALMERAKGETAMGHMGRIQSLKDLPADKVLAKYIREAMALNDAGLKVIKPKKAAAPVKLEVPADFSARLAKNKKARDHFENFAPGQKKEYLSWFADAKTVPTREKRIEQALEWIEEGKIRNWKYVKTK